MSNNSFRGFGAIPQSDSWLANQPGITPLGKQYIDNLNGYWPSANTFGGFAVVTGNATYRLQIFKKKGLTNTYDKLLNPTMPGSLPYGIDYSPDGKFLAAAINATPYVSIYKRNGETFTLLSNPGTLPTGTARDVAFSPDNNYLAVGHGTTPFVTIYKRDGDTFTKIATPFNTLPGGTTLSVAFSPDGNYFAAGMSVSPYVNVWRIDSTLDTFTKITIPTAGSGGAVNSVEFSPDSLHLIYAGGSSPSYGGYLINSSTDTFTALTILGSPATTGQHVAFSPDGVYMSVGGSSDLAILKRNNANNTYSVITSQPPTVQKPAGEVNASAWSADGNYLLVSGVNDPIILYTRTGDTFTRSAATDIQESSFAILAASGTQSGIVWFNAP
jgi:WD40 repeat protein